MSTVSATGSSGKPGDLPRSGPRVLVLMGVSGCGKTTVAALLSDQLGWDFEEGDSLHPQANVDKMAAGHPLNDEDRWPWLDKVAEWINGRLDAHQNGIVTCSALKRSYRAKLARPGVIFVYLNGDQETIAARLARRQGHFMPAALLASQFADLEEPGPDEAALWVSVGPPPGEIVRTITEDLSLGQQTPTIN
ncbi:gluconokinase [Paenarthrobacter sp. Z7-10]|uniref:gluconokinase n=1 Tax=Paenarthrobacter sp. Z7-10 TaxID=2787635 RepID=UPI0022A9C98B|nr:gluconokinase [Paenarthrobacter sp. Z7-10]